MLQKSHTYMFSSYYLPIYFLQQNCVGDNCLFIWNIKTSAISIVTAGNQVLSENKKQWIIGQEKF